MGTSTAAMLLRRSRTSAPWSRSEYTLSARSATPYQRRGPSRSPARPTAPASAGRKRASTRNTAPSAQAADRHDVLGARVEVVGGGDVDRRAVRDRRRVAGQSGERLDDEAARERDHGQHAHRRDEQRRDRVRRRPARAGEQPEPEPSDVGERQRGRDDGHDRHEGSLVTRRAEEELVFEEARASAAARRASRPPRRSRRRGRASGAPARPAARAVISPVASVTAPAVMNSALLAIACVTT